MAKVSDFGLSQMQPEKSPCAAAVAAHTEAAGTVTHMAPEMLCGGSGSCASDVYSFAILGAVPLTLAVAQGSSCSTTGPMRMTPTCMTRYVLHTAREDDPHRICAAVRTVCLPVWYSMGAVDCEGPLLRAEQGADNVWGGLARHAARAFPRNACLAPQPH